jgi:hypothetical protein
MSVSRRSFPRRCPRSRPRPAVELPHRVGHAAEGTVEGDPVDAPGTGGDLLDGGGGHGVGSLPRSRHPEEVHLTPLLGGEVEVPAIRGPADVLRVPVPPAGEVHRLSPVHRLQVQVPGAPMVQPELDDHVGAERAHVRDPPAVGGDLHPAVVVAVLGEAGQLPIHRHLEEIGGAVGDLVQHPLVGGEEDGAPVGEPAEIAGLEPQAGELPGSGAAVDGLQEELGGPPLRRIREGKGWPSCRNGYQSKSSPWKRSRCRRSKSVRGGSGRGVGATRSVRTTQRPSGLGVPSGPASTRRWGTSPLRALRIPGPEWCPGGCTAGGRPPPIPDPSHPRRRGAPAPEAPSHRSGPPSSPPRPRWCPPPEGRPCSPPTGRPGRSPRSPRSSPGSSPPGTGGGGGAGRGRTGR